MSTTFLYVEDSKSEGLLIRAVPEEAGKESLRELPQSVEVRKEPLLHIPNKLRDNDKLLDLVLKDGIYNFTICIQDNDCLSEPLTSFPDEIKLSNWLILLSKELDQKHIQGSNRPAIKVFLVAIDKFIDEKFAPNHEPEEHRKHQKILPVWWPWPPKISRVSHEEAKYSNEICNPELRSAYNKWHDSLLELLEKGGGKEIKIDLAEMPLACKCKGIWQGLHNRVEKIPSGYDKSGGRYDIEL
ncbi:hypothetical protein FOPG_18158 [Fusarium oxysporum f. sp. conglutinans race 2 54008]|uniref:Uncharacterized protein n=1 Tax=Fusarium oxysporum f. sp. conglutinans race 2 54008 TaxID=1089457 RepID=X0H0G1_FUSOX|nr:hypothetical protein FOPG_18158 [Fusarium oxysporum f. sp. conglutinans race 2 54008]